MINAYSSLLEYRENEWENYLDQILLFDIFKPVISYYKNRGTLRCVIHYIVYTYSFNSDKITIGQDWLDNKKKIYEFVCAQPIIDLYEELVHLKNEHVLKTIHQWMDFQQNDIFKNMQSLKDLKIEMQLSSNSKILKANGEVDFTQKFLNAGYVKDLTAMIKELEAELMQNSPKLKEGAKEVRMAKSKFNVGPETFAK